MCLNVCVRQRDSVCDSASSGSVEGATVRSQLKVTWEYSFHKSRAVQQGNSLRCCQAKNLVTPILVAVCGFVTAA